MLYDKVKLVHQILVLVFLIHYVWKGYLLIANKKDTLAAYTAKTRIAEMVVALAFMVTGLWLVLTGAGMTTLLWLKIAMVFASIPIAIIGFKKGNKPMAVLAILLLVGAYGLAEINHKQYSEADKKPTDTSSVAGNPVEVGRKVYLDKCAFCHGEGGDAGKTGAKNLKVTQLTDEQQKDVIRNGVKGTEMNAFPLPDDQLNGLIAYIKTLK